MKPHLNCIAVSAVAFNRLAKGKLRAKINVFSANLADINKALRTKTRTDFRTKLLKYFHDFLDLFSRINADKLPLFRGKEIDYKINFEKKNGKTLKVL